MQVIRGNPIIFDTYGEDTVIELKAADYKILKIKDAQFDGIIFDDAVINNPIIKGGSITGTTIAGGSVTGATITETDLSNVTIEESEYFGGSITGTTIAGGSVSGSTITETDLSNVTIEESEYVGGSITGTTIAGGSITGTIIAGGSVSGATIAGGSITGTTIAGGSVSGATIAGGSITGTTIKDSILIGVDLQSDRIKTNEVYSERSSNDMGNNQLSDRVVLPGLDTSNFRSQGMSTSIANHGVDVGLVGAPYESGIVEYEGGVGAYNLTNNTLIGQYEYFSFTTIARAGVYSDISEDGTYAIVADGAVEGDMSICVFLRNATTGVYQPLKQILPSGFSCKISNTTIISGTIDGYIRVFKRSTVTPANWPLVYTFNTTSSVLINMLDVDMFAGYMAYYSAGKIFVYNGDSTGAVWNILSISDAPSTIAFSFNAGGGSSTGFAMIVTSDNTRVYVRDLNGETIKIFEIPNVTVVASSNLCIFMYSGNKIYIATKKTAFATWVVSYNQTTLDSITSMATNGSYLLCGCSSFLPYGRSVNFQIHEYENVVFILNQMITKDQDVLDQNMYIKSNLGAVCVHGENIEITPTTTTIKTPIVTQGITCTTLTASGLSKSGTLQTGTATITTCNSTTSFASTATSTNLTNTGVAILSEGATAGGFRTSGLVLGAGGGITYGTTGDETGLNIYAFNTKRLNFGTDRMLVQTQICALTGGYGLPSYSFQGLRTSGIFCNNSSSGVDNLYLTTNAENNQLIVTSSARGNFYGLVYIGKSVSQLAGQKSTLVVGNAEEASRSNMVMSRAIASGEGNQTMIQFITNSNLNTTIGTIVTSGTSTSYNTASDYRLKKDVVPMTDGLDIIKQLKPCYYTWIQSPQSARTAGFIAHEIQEVFPQCVTGEKDALNEDGSINPQSVDLAKLGSVFTCAIQQNSARLDFFEGTSEGSVNQINQASKVAATQIAGLMVDVATLRLECEDYKADIAVLKNKVSTLESNMQICLDYIKDHP